MLNRSSFHNPTKVAELHGALFNSISQLPDSLSENTPLEQIDADWKVFMDMIYATASEVFGHSRRSHQDDAPSEIQDLITQRTCDLSQWPILYSSTEIILTAKRSLRMHNGWWHKTAGTQQFADLNDHQNLYKAIKSIYVHHNLIHNLYYLQMVHTWSRTNKAFWVPLKSP